MVVSLAPEWKNLVPPGWRWERSSSSFSPKPLLEIAVLTRALHKSFEVHPQISGDTKSLVTVTVMKATAVLGTTAVLRQSSTSIGGQAMALSLTHVSFQLNHSNTSSGYSPKSETWKSSSSFRPLHISSCHSSMDAGDLEESGITVSVWRIFWLDQIDYSDVVDRGSDSCKIFLDYFNNIPMQLG
jgi:hypothetical protein